MIITGFTVKGATSEDKSGIALEGAKNCNILSNNCLNNYVGIGLRSSIYNIIKNNNCNSNRKAGIVLFQANKNDIINNICWNNEYGIAISEESGGPVCVAEQTIYQSNQTDPETILDPIRQFRDKNLKTKYVSLYYEYSSDVKKVLISKPMLSIEAFGLIMKYMPAIRYINGEGNGEDLYVNKADVEQVILFTEKLKSAIDERRGEIGAGRRFEIIRLLEEVEKQFSTSKGKKFSQAFQSSIYFAQNNSELLSRSFENAAIINNTIIGNEIDGINCYYTEAVILNTILWDNGSQGINLDYSSATVYYSDVQGGWEGIGNIDADPMFVDAENGDYHLSDYSPCIGAGTSEGAPVDDIEGNPRGTPPDMGAYEHLFDTPLQLGDVSGDGYVTAYDASLVLQHAVGLTTLLPEQQQAADVTGDNTVSALDAALILQYTVGLITKFPAENITVAPALKDKTETKLLTEAIEQLDTTPLTKEQKKVLEQLKNLVFSQLIPKHTALLQNYPNPFNPSTWLPYKLATDAPVTISIYNKKGQLVRKLHLGLKTAGNYFTKDKAAYFSGTDSLGENVASGVYFYQLQAGKFRATKKMVILK